jgi:DNA-binding NtrC family response regulator
MNNNGPTRLRGLPLVVVVAEEDAIMRATLAALLSCDGYRVFQAENLNAAISCLQRVNDLTVLFADLNMPGWKSMVDYAKQTSPDTFVIAMAGNDAIPEISDLRRYGIQAFLQKPLLYNDVRQALSVTVKRPRAA